MNVKNIEISLQQTKHEKQIILSSSQFFASSRISTSTSEGLLKVFFFLVYELNMENEHESLINFMSCLLNDCRVCREEEEERTSFMKRVDFAGAQSFPYHEIIIN